MAAIFTRISTADQRARAEREARSGRAFSISRLLASMTGEGKLDGYEREVYDTINRAAGGRFDLQRIGLPLCLLADPTTHPDYLARDMSVSSATNGGHLVGTSTAPVVDLLRPWSVAARAGATIIPLSTKGFNAGPLSVPTVDSRPTGYWLSGEASALTPTAPTLGKLTLRPKSAGVLSKYSRQLLRQTDGAVDALLQREFLTVIGRLIDEAILAGTGADGQPRGIVNTVGVTATSGAFDLADALTMEESASAAGADDAGFAFLTTPTGRKLLKQRPLITGGTDEVLWVSATAGESVGGRRAYATPHAPADTLVAGPWSDVLLAMWSAPRIEINPNDPAGFKVGTFEARMIVDVDVAVRTPAAWSVHSSLT